MQTIVNDDIDNYFVVANEPYQVRDANGRIKAEIHRGQYFRWSHKLVPANNCSGCGKTSTIYILLGFAFCDNFKDENGNQYTLSVPEEKLEETYDTEDEGGVCESWFHETGGYNFDIFTPPHLRDGAEQWNDEKRKS